MKTSAPRMCEDCGIEVIGKYKRRRCERCYRRVLRREKGTVPPGPRGIISLSTRPDLYAKVFGKTTPGPDGCVIYIGLARTRGYARVYVGGRRHSGVHRVAYELLVGPIPDGMTIDHLCHNRSTSCSGGAACIHRRCVNPLHLEAVTSEENTRRASARPNSRMGGRGRTGNPRKRMEFCRNGHEMTPENTTWEKRPRLPDGRIARCRTCRRATQAAFHERQRRAAAIP